MSGEVLEAQSGARRSFVTAARRAAVAWKNTTRLLPEAARSAAPYGSRPGALPFVLPAEHRWLNLLPAAREVARSRFEAAGIHWHGDEDAPSAHLLSSQIQCLNALAPLVDRPDLLARWLGQILPVESVLPFGAPTSSAWDATDHVVFEWQGLADHLGEWRGGVPSRGTRATSIDAAVRYRAPGGKVEMALIEWKYVESYPNGGLLTGSAYYQRQRVERYRPLAEDPQGPLCLGGDVGYEDLLAEPTYQLMRQQLLAWRMEVEAELEVSRVVVVHCAPSANAALLQDSLGGDRFERLGRARGGLIPAWQALLRRTDRFVSFDTAKLVAPDSVCDDDFKDRYAHLASPAGESTVPIAEHDGR